MQDKNMCSREVDCGSIGDSYDNTLAESVIGLYKGAVICRLGSWRYSENGKEGG